MPDGQHRPGPPSGLLQRGAEWTLALALVCLGLQEIGALKAPVLPFDVVSAVGAPLWLALAWPERRALLASPLLRAWLLLAAAWWWASLVHVGDLRSLALNLAKGLQSAIVVLGVAAVARRTGFAAQRRAWLWGVVPCLAVGFAGYAVRLVGFEGLAFGGPHPLFPGLPRMVGTFGESPQHFGEYLVVSLGIAHALGNERSEGALGRGVRIAGWLALGLTFSTAWVGGACLALGLRPLSRLIPSPALRGGIAFMLALAATWLVTFSLPRAAPARGSLRELDPAHIALQCDEGGRCEQQMRYRPYPAPLTLYRLSKEQAGRAALRSFPWGLGPGGFEAFVRDDLGNEKGRTPVYYQQPHSTYLGILAELGLPGLLALGYFLWALGGAGTPGLRPLWLSLIGLMLVGLNIDVLRQRHLWVAVGLLAASGREGHVNG